jgi:hypothetical protein
MDVGSYNYIQDATSSLSKLPRLFSASTADILQELRENKVLVLEDYGARLAHTEVTESLSRVLQADISDKRVLKACMSSMKLWQGYLSTIAELGDYRSQRITDEIIPRLKLAEQAISEDSAYALPDIGTYLYECLGDINSTLFVAQMHDLPLYDWESYVPFYEYKIAKARGLADSIKLDNASRVLQHMLEIFVPDFNIRSADDIMAIRSDKRFAATRSIISSATSDNDADELVKEAANGILQMKEGQEKFNKIVKLATVPLDLLPVPAAGTAVEEATDRLYERHLGHKYSWQLFFLNARKKYSKDPVRRLLQRGE